MTAKIKKTPLDRLVRQLRRRAERGDPDVRKALDEVAARFAKEAGKLPRFDGQDEEE